MITTLNAPNAEGPCDFDMGPIGFWGVEITAVSGDTAACRLVTSPGPGIQSASSDPVRRLLGKAYEIRAPDGRTHLPRHLAPHLVPPEKHSQKRSSRAPGTGLLEHRIVGWAARTAILKRLGVRRPVYSLVIFSLARLGFIGRPELTYPRALKAATIVAAA